MVEPFRKFDQLKQTHFIQDQTLAVYVGISIFDNVLEKKKDGGFKPHYSPLPAVKSDCALLDQCLQKYQIYKEEDISRLDNDPTFKDLSANHRRIHKQMLSNPDRQFCLIWLFAGHGILKLGMQTIVVNEFDKSSTFYKLYNAEEIIRVMANGNQNAYMITIFACCRQLHDAIKMQGFFSKDQVAHLQEHEAPDEPDFVEMQKQSVYGIQKRGHNVNLDSAKGRQNFIFIWGCRPSSGVEAETAMVEELVKMLSKKCDRDTMTIELPYAFQNMVGRDANYEMVTSNTIQPILLSYQHNMVSHSIAYIFVNTGCKDLEYKDHALKKQKTESLYKKYLEFDEVQVFENKSKQEIIDILNNLKLKALEYESETSQNTGRDKKLLALSITWIGFKLQASWHPEHKLILKDVLAEYQQKVQLLPTKVSLQGQIQSNAPYVREYAITALGEPICLNEYAAMIVSETKRTHIVLNEDYSFWMGFLLKKHHINLDAGIDEFKLAEHTGRERLYYGFNIKCLRIYDYFKQARKRDRHVFQFPHHLKLSGADIKNFSEIIQQNKGSGKKDEFMLDLRNEEELRQNMTREKTCTLKPDLDIWNERPMLIKELDGLIVRCRTQLDAIEGRNQIVMIKAYDDDSIDFDFYDSSTKSYKLIQQVNFKRFHFNVATFAEDLRTEEENDHRTQTAILYTSQKHMQPYMLVRFNQPEEAKGTKIQIEKEQVFSCAESDRVLNAFEITADSILVATQISLHLYTYTGNHWAVKNYLDYSKIGYGICSATCFHSGTMNRLEFFVSFNMNDTELCPNNEHAYKRSDKNTYNSFVAAYRLDEESKDFFITQDIKRRSILIKNENVASLSIFVKKHPKITI